MNIIIHEANGLQIGQRREDGYINLTKMAQASDKDLHDYLRLKITKSFLEELSLETGIPGSKIVQIYKGRGDKIQQGTWGHPQVAINCGQWCSPKFAVLVSKWVVDWMTIALNPVDQNLLNVANAYIESSQALNRVIHTAIHQQTNSLREASNALKIENANVTKVFKNFPTPKPFASKLQHVPYSEYSTSIPYVVESTPHPVKELTDDYSASTDFKLKAISLWQPWASLIPLGLKHYETRSWKTNYRGKLLICSTAVNSKQHKEYLKICDQLQLPPWSDFPHGCAIALCDLVDCIEMTQSFIAQQSATEILCGDWQVGRYAWKLENIHALTEPFAVKGKQGLFSITVTNLQLLEKENFSSNSPFQEQSKAPNSKSSLREAKPTDCWYTPPHIVELVVRVLGGIDLDPCADDDRQITARSHFTASDDGLLRSWNGRVFMNPPYSCPGKWMKKLQAEVELGRVTEAIALLPAATDTNWLSPVLHTQPVCFWKGRIKFLDANYQPKLAARQSHVLVYWGENWEKFKEVFDPHGFVSVPNQFLGDKPIEKISPRKTPKPIQDEDKSDIQIHNAQTSSQFLGDKLDLDISPRKIGSESEFLGDNPSDEISPRKTRRRKGDGSGNIHWRTITKNGKDYQEAYYHYEFWNGGDRLIKSTKYIPKRLLTRVQGLEQEKAPVREILGVLGVVFE
ncbi:DNA N-6-adenine-methyltransferase [Tolypothrix sp. NIES-4075]|uniref:DNA N-6-adenine-methyltransferase n=1 Tax=Tolypothrix sp. NIES-4075 TaxID=2005459 RepID=UPI00190EF1CE|nr:DNA N-6-adenine-methyltransferase [Tolypothrix sp. NIES-4075]